MSPPRDDATRPGADDAAFVERLREGYRLEPLAPSRRAAFDTAWEAEVLFSEELGTAATSDDERMFPPDYLALASAFDL